jgi:phosphoglycolate phosphatase-like HAD superfamily hydrolase
MDHSPAARGRPPRPADPGSRPAPSPILPDASAYIFDVEGTLVDAVMPTLRCWRETLEGFGYSVWLVDLHRYSGMDGGQMLDQLLPQPVPKALKQDILDRQGKRYRQDYLPRVQAFPGVRVLFEYLKAEGCRVALGTDCQKDELDHYLDRANIRDLIDAIGCGDDVKHGKPCPDIFELARKRLKVRAGDAIVCVGDTPYDAAAARAAGMPAVGVLTGHFAARELLAGGCVTTLRDPHALLQSLKSCRESREGILARTPAVFTTGDHDEPHQSEHESLRPRSRNNGERRTRYSEASRQG